ncbi:MAG: outer membrane beta-barrel protein [Burkholderiales bacterium]
MKRTAILIAALAGALLATHVQAQQPGQGGYLGIGYGSVWSDGGSFFANTINEDTVAGAKIYAGYMTSEYLGLEVGLHNLGKYEVFLLGTKTDEFKTTAVSVAGVLSVPVGGGYYFNGRLGLAFTNVEYDCLQGCGVAPLVDTKKRGTSGLLGLGLGAKLGQSAEVRIDFDHFGSVHHAVGTTEYKDSYDILSVNLVLLF